MSGDTATIADMTADVQKGKTRHEVLDQTTSNVPNAEHKQDAGTMGKCGETEGQESYKRKMSMRARLRLSEQSPNNITETRMFKRW